MNQQLALTLPEVALWDLEHLDLLDRGDDLVYSPAEATATVAAWAWLLGAEPGSAAFEKAREEVLTDGGIFAALHRPVDEFLTWFRRTDWNDFRPDDEELHAWAWALVDRARSAGASAGTLARQVSVVVLVGKQTAS